MFYVFDGLKITWASNEDLGDFEIDSVFDGLKITWASNLVVVVIKM